MDTTLFLAIHGLAGHWTVLDYLAIFFAKYAIYFFSLICVFFLWYKKRSLSDCILVGIFALGINQVIGHFFFRFRPFVALHLQPLIDGASGKSFPSDHTALAFALATVFAHAYPRWRILAYGCALSIGLARIVVGVHYPGDILGGVGVGIASGYAARDFFSRFVGHPSHFYGRK